MRKKQHAFVEECADEHRADMLEAISNGDRYASTTIDAVGGWVEIVSDCRGGAAVTVHHDNEENQRECPLLWEAIEKALPEWEDVKEEFESNDDEDCGGPDPAFPSCSDYWDYIFRT
jgi:hypothetical protein|nr:MAG TPA: hypothetical protein [Caudoviricetes sp.]